MKKAKTTKPYWEMTVEELAEATKEFDKTIPLSKTRPLTKTERERFEKSRRGGVRSIVIARGKAKPLTIPVDARLLDRCADYASSHNMTLAEFVNRSLRGALAVVEGRK